MICPGMDEEYYPGPTGFDVIVRAGEVIFDENGCAMGVAEADIREDQMTAEGIEFYLRRTHPPLTGGPVQLSRRRIVR